MQGCIDCHSIVLLLISHIAAPLTAAANIAIQGSSPDRFALPTWSLAIGALGIAVGVAAYGSRLVRTVGSEITEIDKLLAEKEQEILQV